MVEATGRNSNRGAAPMISFKRLAIRREAVVITAAFLMLFWGLRFAYWIATEEAPFSDLADYAAVGENIASRLFFGFNDQKFAYYTPITPSFIALAKIIGGDYAPIVFRLIVTSILCVGTLGLAYELAKITERKWIGYTTLFIVALSKPSIFWSYKYCTETVSEALLAATLAISLSAIRLDSRWLSFAAGLTATMLFLNRPQFLPGVILLGGLLSPTIRSALGQFRGPSQSAPLSPPRQRMVTQIARSPLTGFVLGVSIVWAPWIGRNYARYEELVPISTSGTEALLWEYGGAPIQANRYSALPLPNGESLSPFGIDAVRNYTAAQTDVESQNRSQELVAEWVKLNAPDLPKLIWWRLKHFASANGANGLTQVSRDVLFAAPTRGYNNPIPQQAHIVNLALLDKGPWVCAFGVFGIISLFSRSRAASLAVGSLLVVPWVTAALVIGYERTVESLITPLLIMAFYGFVEFASRISKAP